MHYLLFCAGYILISLACTDSNPGTKNAQPAIQMATSIPGSLYPVVVKGKWGYINEKKEIVIKPQFDGAENFSEGLAVVTRDSTIEDKLVKLQGYIDSTGLLITDYKFGHASPFSERFAAIEEKGKWGFIDRKGVHVIPCIYEEVSKFSEGLASVKLNGKNGFIDHSGKMVISPKFARACWVSDFSQGLAAVYTSEEGPGGYIDSSGNMVIEPKFNYVGIFSEGLALVQPTGSNLYGYINKKGEMVIMPRYELGLSFAEGVAAVKQRMSDGKTIFQLINKTGEVIADRLDYAFVGIFREGRAGVETFDQRWGFIDARGKEIIPPKFASVKLFENGLSRVETGSFFKGLKVQYIDKMGNIVWKAP